MSGWDYRSWNGVFSPPGLAVRRRLEYASRRFNSLEINASFYRLLTPDTFRRWYRQTPRGFRFAVKAHLAFEPERLERFLRPLPQDTRAAAHLARAHDRRLAGRSFTRGDRRRRLRHALEARDESYRVPELARIARRHRIALVVSDSGDWPRIEAISGDFVYIRLHGRPRTYASRARAASMGSADSLVAGGPAAGRCPSNRGGRAATRG